MSKDDHTKIPLTRSMLENTPPDVLARIEAETGISAADAILDPEEVDYLPTDVAARMFLANPASIGFNLFEFPQLFGISEFDVGDELSAGRLIAWVCDKASGGGQVSLVSGTNLMAWVNNPETPKRIRKKLQRVAGGEGAFFARRVKCVPLKVGPLR